MPKLFPIVNAKTDTELFSDLDATVAWAKSQGGDGGRLGIMGFCRGGRTVWHYSTHNPNLKAGVAFYGSLDRQKRRCAQELDRPRAEVKAPVLGLYGADDAGIKVEQVKEWKPRSRPPARPRSFMSILARRTASTPTTAQAIARRPPKMPGSGCIGWFKKYGVLS